MSQFVLLERSVNTRDLSAIVLSPVDAGSEGVVKVAMDYFGNWRGCRLVTDDTGRGEPLIDDLCDAQQDSSRIEETTLARLLGLVVASGVGFVIWHGVDSSNLPTAQTWSEVLEELRSQTRLQPADVWLRFVPRE